MVANKVILLIDDDEIFNYLNSRIVEESGRVNSVKACLSGKEALEYLLTCISNGEPLPRLIFLDVKMPLMDGHSFLKSFAELPQEEVKDVKIAMLSSSLDPRDVQQSTRYSNVIGFLEKPLDEFKLEEIFQKIEM